VAMPRLFLRDWARLALVTVALGLLSNAAMAGQSGSVALSGYIPRICTLSMGTDALGAPEIQENCNEITGYTVAVAGNSTGEASYTVAMAGITESTGDLISVTMTVN
jgi:hypothetical protein